MSTGLADPREGESLESFLRKNEKTLGALGVLAALAVLPQGLSNAFFKEVLSGISTFGMILVWYEVYSKLPKRSQLRLFLFQYVLLWGGWALVAFWLYEFRFLSNLVLFPLLSILIFWLFVTSLLPVVKRIRFIRWAFGLDVEKSVMWQKVVLLAFAVALTVIAILTGFSLAMGTNTIFDVIKKAGM